MESVPETALRARQDYIDGKTVKAILADSDFCLDQLCHWLDGRRQTDGTTLLPPIPRRRIIVRKEGRAATRLALVERLMRAAEMQIHSMEQRMASAGYEANPGDARVTAVLARTMRELGAHDEQSPTRKPSKERSESNDDSTPLDIDELRKSLLQNLKLLSPSNRARFIAWHGLEPATACMGCGKSMDIRAHQQPPRIANNAVPWTTWLILGGRGAGKTSAGAEWVRDVATNDPHARIALIGETEHDAREVMVEGVSGLLAVHRETSGRNGFHARN